MDADAVRDSVRLLGVELTPARAAEIARELTALATRLAAPSARPAFEEEPLDILVHR